jgi:hypothetical protein
MSTCTAKTLRVPHGLQAVLATWAPQAWKTRMWILAGRLNTPQSTLQGLPKNRGWQFQPEPSFLDIHFPVLAAHLTQFDSSQIHDSVAQSQMKACDLGHLRRRLDLGSQ